MPIAFWPMRKVWPAAAGLARGGRPGQSGRDGGGYQIVVRRRMR